MAIMSGLGDANVDDNECDQEQGAAREDRSGSPLTSAKESNSLSSIGDTNSLGPTASDGGEIPSCTHEGSMGEFSSIQSERGMGLGASYGTSLNDETDEEATVSSRASESSKPDPSTANSKPAAQSNRQVSFGSAISVPLTIDSQRLGTLASHIPEDQSMTENDDTEAGESFYSKGTSQGEESDYNDVSPRPGLHGSKMGSSEKVLVHSNKRLSLSVDLETGIEGGTRSQQAWIRPQQTVPQNAARRRRQGIKTMMYNKSSNALSFIARRPIKHENREQEDDDDMRTSTHGRLAVRETRVVVDDGNSSDDNDDDAIVRRPRTQLQYNLQTIQERGQLKNKLSMAFGLPTGTQGVEGELAVGSNKRFSLKYDFLVIKYFHWTFRSSFSAVFCSGAIAFFGLTLLFAVLIYFSGMNKQSCIHVNGVDFGTTGANFMDAYALSWTTFSTVGYGLVFPATSATNHNIRRCTGITILTTMESFVGILFASICGAILFAKVTRIASFAQVSFSDPIVIRYGTGVVTEEGDDDDDEAKSSDEDGEFGDLENKGAGTVKPRNLPCPILEFRVINRLHGVIGGEIIDASMNMVACVDEKQAPASTGRPLGSRRRGKKGKKRGPRRGVHHHREGSVSSISEHASHRLMKAKETVRELFREPSMPSEVKRDSQILGSKVYAKLDIESPEHPFFKRVWFARHVLDHTSPLLLPPARELVKRNGGHWPEELNSAMAVRKVVKFDQILVSLSGTSNVDANSVYAQKAYDHVDLCIGYRFCDILFREADGSLGVDSSLLNDVTEQAGGGGEPLDNRGETDTRLSLVG